MLAIILAILVNLLLIGGFCSTFLITKRFSYKVNLLHLAVVAIFGVGFYFLVSNLSFLTTFYINYFTSISLLSYHLTLVSILVGLVYGILLIIRTIKENKKTDTFNNAKMKRAKALDKRTERRIKRAERRALRKTLKGNQSKKMCIINIILCVVLSLITIGIIYFQTKTVLEFAENKTQVTWLDEGYKYTLPGQLDKLI